MNVSKRAIVAVAATALALATAGCETDPATGQQTMTRGGKGATAGAVGGALLGGLIGGNATGALVGASIGALAGGGAGAYMDKQERDLRARTAGTGIHVERQGDAIKLEMPSSVTFAFNSSELQPQFMPTLNQVAQTLASYQSTYIQIIGHTDSVGSAAANQKLSEARAASVANYLIGNGVSSARVTIHGMGLTQPIASNDTEEGRAQNRRVEIKLTPIVEQQNGQPNPPAPQ
jgi:outer membrane protein OmpA-like peptidoglycan-associated protein